MKAQAYLITLLFALTFPQNVQANIHVSGNPTSQQENKPAVSAPPESQEEKTKRQQTRKNSKNRGGKRRSGKRGRGH